ncbi:hypothetical protein [Fictibacillus phosphorivorans]|uniref:hypothetical protein n=1 Tax=Fictibacillus phosphorivorans TaxID=1221500 RepID=UPI0035EC26B5
MFEEEAILPDDFQADQPQSEEVLQEQEPVSEELDTLEPDQTEELEQPQLTPEQLKFKVKYNHEEQELGYEEAVPLIQKGMNYDKLQERIQQFESDPRLAFIEELAQENNMSTEEFINTVKESRQQRELDELIQQNIPEEYAKEMLESRKFREQQKAEQRAKEDEAKKNAEFVEFFDYFKQSQGKDFDPDNDQIPQEVWELNAQGVPMKYAYMEHHNKQLQSKLSSFKQNEVNAKRAPVGSLTTHGSTEVASEDDFLKGFNS